MTRTRVWINSPYHNYNDRRKVVIGKDDINNYNVVYRENNVGFNWGDFVNSSCVTTCDIAIFNNIPNYLILLDGSNISARYYVIKHTFISGEPNGKSKYNVALLRDVISDVGNVLLNSPCKITRGMIDTAEYDIRLFNDETITSNKIKVNQEAIKMWDNDTRWITIFYDGTTSTDLKLQFNNSGFVGSAISKETFLNDWHNASPPFNVIWNNNNNIPFNRNWEYQELNTQIFISDANGYNRIVAGTFTTRIFPNGSVDFSFDINNYGNYNSQTIINAVNRAISDSYTFLGHYDRNELFNNAFATNNNNINYNNRYTDLRNKYQNSRVHDDTYVYRVSISELNQNINMNPYIDISTKLFQRSFFSYYGSSITVEPGNNISQYIVTSRTDWNMSFLEIGNYQVEKTYTMTLPKNIILDESPAACVTIPYGNDITLSIDGINYIMGLDISTLKSISTQGQEDLSTYIYDIQLLPYCPLKELNSIYASNSPSDAINFAVDSINVSARNVPIYDELNNVVHYGMVVQYSSYDIRVPISSINNFQEKDYKISSLLQSVRLVSPDHKSAFQYTPALNDTTDYLSIQSTAKPINTTYRICPVFNNSTLYGGNWKDSRGLIWEGGFSLPKSDDPWTTYKLNNSTYKSIFDNEISYLETSRNRSISVQDKFATTALENGMVAASTALANGLIDGLTNISLGGMPGVGAGVAAHGTSQLVTSSLSFASNVYQNLNNYDATQFSISANREQLKSDISFKSTMFNLNNQAIEARASALTKLSDFNIVNLEKVFIEFYDGSSIDYSTVKEYIRYNSISINRIDFIINYNIKGSYISFTPIFLTGLSPQISQQIMIECIRGFYFDNMLNWGTM